MPSIELHKLSRPSMWRKMALMNWGHPTDPQVYGRVEVDMTKTLAYMEAETQRAGIRITPIVLVIRTIALCFRKFPEANAIVRRNQIYQ